MRVFLFLFGRLSVFGQSLLHNPGLGQSFYPTSFNNALRPDASKLLKQDEVIIKQFSYIINTKHQKPNTTSMKSLFILLTALVGSFICKAQNLKIDTLLTDKISIRAINIYKGKVWYAGSMSKFGYVNIRKPKLKSQIQLNTLNQEFRVIARFKENFFEIINIGSPAQVYGISLGFRVSKLLKYDDAGVFFDSFVVNPDNNNGIAISDPLEDGTPNFLITSKKRHDKNKNNTLPKYYKGEAHFAASNSNIAYYKDEVWIATGGTKARIFKFNFDSPYHWEVFDTPFIQGTSSQGIYSIDFANEKFGVAVGGDYTKQSDNVNNIATTNDGGKTWQIQASGNNAGYMTCVKIKPKSKGKEMIALGDQHISYSSDFGKTWTKISDEKGFYTAEWISNKALVLAGKDKIVKLTLRQ